MNHKVYLTHFMIERLKVKDHALYKHMVNTYTRSWSIAGATFYKVTDHDAKVLNETFRFELVKLDS